MTAPTTLVPALNFLDAAYLGGWNAHPASGSLITPRWDVTRSGFKETILRDGRTAANAIELAGAVLQDGQQFRDYVQDQGYQLPQPLPARAAGWFLSNFTNATANEGGSAHFEQAEHPKRLTLDLRNPKAAVFEVILQKGATELTQRISIDRQSLNVTTDYYFLKTRMSDPAKAADFVTAVATLVYDSGQYDAEKELGALKIRDTETGEERTFRRTKNRYTFRGKIPSVNEIQLSSALSVFEEAGSYREPILTVSVGGLQSEGPYPVSLLLYRPPNRPQRRMPLKARLQNVLWQSIEKRVESSAKGESHAGSTAKV